MVVELKKCKITKSIVDQSLNGGYKLFYDWERSYDILGWCIFKTTKRYLRYNLLYHRNDNQIIKLPYIVNKDKDIELFKESVQRKSEDNIGYIYPNVYKLRLRWTDFNNSQIILEQTNQTDETMQELFQKVKDFKHIVEQKGQIYL